MILLANILLAIRVLAFRRINDWSVLEMLSPIAFSRGELNEAYDFSIFGHSRSFPFWCEMTLVTFTLGFFTTVSCASHCLR
jgi:hypothetical protein